jgi:hypothetical protein
MSCTYAVECAANIGAVFPAATSLVASVSSDATGAITITYQPSVLPPPWNVLAISPVDPATVTPIDLSYVPQPTPAHPIPFVWGCGIAQIKPGAINPNAAATTILAKYLPAGCK